MKRARQAHQKQARRQAILSVALAMLPEASFREITMTQVAARAGLVKGTLYLYFATKEELFLELLRNQLHGWFWELETRLEELPRRGRLQAAARLIAETAADRPCLRKLLAVLHGTLESNLPEPTVLAFKRELLARTLSMGVLFERTLRFLAPGQGVRLLLHVYALVIGVQAMVDSAPSVRRVLEAPEFSALQLDFAQELHTALEAAMRGLKQEARQGHRIP